MPRIDPNAAISPWMVILVTLVALPYLLGLTRDLRSYFRSRRDDQKAALLILLDDLDIRNKLTNIWSSQIATAVTTAIDAHNASKSAHAEALTTHPNVDQIKLSLRDLKDELLAEIRSDLDKRGEHWDEEFNRLRKNVAAAVGGRRISDLGDDS